MARILAVVIAAFFSCAGWAQSIRDVAPANPLNGYNTYNDYERQSIWITIYDATKLRQLDHGCVKPKSNRKWESGKYVRGFIYHIRAEVMETDDPGCKGRKVCDTTVQVDGTREYFAVQQGDKGSCYFEAVNVRDRQAMVTSKGVERAPLCQTYPQKIPAGSYQASCRLCSTANRPDRLNAECMDTKQIFQKAWLDNLPTCAQGSIRNVNGVLYCTRTNAPAGPYAATCRDIDIDSRNALSAQCKDARQQFARRSEVLISTCKPGTIENEGGILVCHHTSWPDNMPKGSYRSSCRNLTFKNSVLAGECQDSTGALKRTQIPVMELGAFGCSTGRYQNVNGQLACGK